MRRVFALFLLTAGFALAHAQQVTLSMGPATADKVVAEVAKQSGETLTIDRVMALEVLAIHVADMPVEQVKEHIAKAVSGRWDTNGNLEPDRAAWRTQERAEAEARLAVMRKSLEERINPPKVKNENQYQREPSVEAAVVAACDLQQVAALLPGQRVVFSTAPTRMQRPIRGNISQQVRTMISEHNRMAALESSARSEEEEEMLDDETFRLMQMFEGFDRPRKPIEAAPSKVVVAFSRGSQVFGDSTRAQIMIFDNAGNVLLSEETGVRSGGDWDEMIEVAMEAAESGEAVNLPNLPRPKEQDKKTLPLENAEDEVEVSDEMKELMQMFQTDMPQPEQIAKFRALMGRPVERDPLAVGQGAFVIPAAKQAGIQVIACLPDDFSEPFGFGDTTVGGILNNLAYGSETTGEMQDGVLIALPSQPASARRQRINRGDLQILVQKAISGTYRLADLAEFAGGHPFAEGNPIYMTYQTVVLRTGGMGMMAMMGGGGPSNWSALRVYDALGRARQKQLEQGSRQWRIASLGSKGRSVLNEFIYGAGAKLSTGEPTTPEPGPMGIMSQMMMGMAGGSDGSTTYLNEPTEALPNGIPTTGVIEIEVRKTFAARSASEDAISTLMGTMGPDEVAMMQTMSQAMAGTEASGFMPRMDKFRLGERYVLDIRVRPTPEVYAQASLNDDVISDNSPVYGLDDLPEDAKASLAAANKRLEPFKQMFQMFGGMDGAGRRTDPPLN